MLCGKYGIGTSEAKVPHKDMKSGQLKPGPRVGRKRCLKIIKMKLLDSVLSTVKLHLFTGR